MSDTAETTGAPGAGARPEGDDALFLRLSALPEEKRRMEIEDLLLIDQISAETAEHLRQRLSSEGFSSDENMASAAQSSSNVSLDESVSVADESLTTGEEEMSDTATSQEAVIQTEEGFIERWRRRRQERSLERVERRRARKEMKVAARAERAHQWSAERERKERERALRILEELARYGPKARRTLQQLRDRVISSSLALSHVRQKGWRGYPPQITPIYEFMDEVPDRSGSAIESVESPPVEGSAEVHSDSEGNLNTGLHPYPHIPTAHPTQMDEAELKRAQAKARGRARQRLRFVKSWLRDAPGKVRSWARGGPSEVERDGGGRHFYAPAGAGEILVNEEKTSSEDSVTGAVDAVKLLRKLRNFWQNARNGTDAKIHAFRTFREQRGWKQAEGAARTALGAGVIGGATYWLVSRPAGRVLFSQLPVYLTGPMCATLAAVPLAYRVLNPIRSLLGRTLAPWMRYRYERAARNGFDRMLTQRATAFETDRAAALEMIAREKDKTTKELVNTNDEEVILKAFDAYLWQKCGEIPMFASVDGYIEYLFPRLVDFCDRVALPENNPQDEKAEPRDPRIRKLKLSRWKRNAIARCSTTNPYVPKNGEAMPAQERLTHLIQIAAAHAQGLRKWHCKRSSGQIYGALGANAFALGSVAGPIGPLACGAVAAARWGVNAYKFSGVDIERGKSGKIRVNMDPAHFDAGGCSLFSQGNFIADLIGDKDKALRKEWTETGKEKEKVNDWLGRIKALSISDEELKEGSLRSPKHLAIHITKDVQEKLVDSTEHKKVRGMKKSDAEIQQKKDEIEHREKGRTVAMDILQNSPVKIADLEREAEDKRILFETESTRLDSSRKRCESRREEKERESTTLGLEIDKFNEQIAVQMGKEALNAQEKAGRIRQLEDKRTLTMRGIHALEEEKQGVVEKIEMTAQSQDHEGWTLNRQLRAIEENIQKRENELRDIEIDIRSERMVAADVTIQTTITTLENKVAVMEKRRNEIREDIERLARTTDDETQKVATLNREHSRAAAAVDREKARLQQAKQDLEDAGRFASAALVTLRKELEVLEKGEELSHMTYEQIGQNDDASKAFAIWVMDSWERLKSRPSGFSKFFMPILRPVGATMGHGAAEVVKVGGGTVLVGTAMGATVYVSGAVASLFGAAQAAAALMNPMTWGLIGAGAGIMTGYSLTKEAWKNFTSWKSNAGAEKKS